jgi:hypothetical protein
VLACGVLAIVAPRSSRRTPRYVLERARQAPAPGSGVVPGSTPVVYLGDPARARVATLGINPPQRQFLDASGRLLTGGRRRLATLDSLGVRDHSELTPAHAAVIVDECTRYFDRHPYHWFETLDDIVRTGLGASYFAGTACHLDLVQWATTTNWAGLPPAMQADLLAADVGFVRRRLDEGDLRVVVVTGRPALRWVQESGLVTWQRAATLDGTPPASVYTGVRDALRFVGWSCNVQAHAGAAAHAPRLAELAAELCSLGVMAPTAS